MTKERIEKAIDVINYAIENNITVKEASVKSGYANSYVKNIRALIYEKYNDGLLEDELFSMFNDKYDQYIKNKSQKNISNNSGNNKNDNKNQSINKKNKTVFVKKNDNEAEVEWVGNTKNRIKTLDQLLDECDVDLETWKVKDYVVNKWDVALKTKTGEPQIIENFQVKAKLERIQEMVDVFNVVDVFKDMIQNYEPPLLNPRFIPESRLDNESLFEEENLLEISIFDLHIGKLAWGGETGENYDTKIARNRFIASIETLLNRASGFKYERILFPVGNDFFNSDTILNTTTKGTPQDEDLRWQKTFMVGVNLLVDAINLLKQTGVDIDVVVVPGNHDFERSFYMGAYLEAWFSNDHQVNIDNNASPRKYYRYGEVLLGLTHGSEEKESSLPMIMANDIISKPHWSETKYHEWHLGHQHRKKDIKYITTNEDLGVTIRYLSSLSGTEEWHHKKGYIGQIKAADAFIWNAHMGLMAHLNSNLKI